MDDRVRTLDRGESNQSLLVVGEATEALPASTCTALALSPEVQLRQLCAGIRAKTDVIERGEMLLAAKSLYELAYPGARPGGRRTKGKPQPVAGWSRYLVRETGCSERSVQQHIEIARSLTPRMRGGLRGTILAGKTRTLLLIGRLSPEQQDEVLGLYLATRSERAVQATVGSFFPPRARPMPSADDLITRAKEALDNLRAGIQLAAHQGVALKLLLDHLGCEHIDIVEVFQLAQISEVQET